MEQNEIILGKVNMNTKENRPMLEILACDGLVDGEIVALKVLRSSHESP